MAPKGSRKKVIKKVPRYTLDQVKKNPELLNKDNVDKQSVDSIKYVLETEFEVEPPKGNKSEQVKALKYEWKKKDQRERKQRSLEKKKAEKAAAAALAAEKKKKKEEEEVEDASVAAASTTAATVAPTEPNVTHNHHHHHHHHHTTHINTQGSGKVNFNV